ncbi:MAG: HIT family protein [Breznakia sp.]
MCVFCNIVKGEIPCYKLYEDEHVLAFLDISQVTKGHCLLITKKHYKNFLEVSEQDLSYAMMQAQQIAKHLQSVLQCSGFNILSNIEEVAGQSVFHFHIHIIPRYTKDDAIKIEFQKSNEQDLKSLQSLLMK